MEGALNVMANKHRSKVCVPNKMATEAMGMIESPGKRCSSNSTVSFAACLFFWLTKDEERNK